MNAHCILEDDLVLYALGELEGNQKKHLESHLSLCPACRRRIDQYRQVRGHVAVLTNAGEVARQRDDLKQRILTTAEALPAASGPPRRLVWRWQPALAIVLALAVVVALASTSDVAGHFPFSQYIGFTPSEDRVNRSENPANPAEPPGQSVRDLLQELDTGAPVPEGWEVPDELPLGLYRVDSYVTEHGPVSHYFLSNEYGFEVSIRLEDVDTAGIQMSGRNAVATTVLGTDILVDRRSSGHVNSLLWVDDDTLITVLIVRAFGGLMFTPAEFLPVAEAIIQDRNSREVGE